MSKLWTEIWTRPGDANYGRVIDDPGESQASFHDGINQIGDGTLQITNQFTRFDEILLSDPTTPANAVSSTVKVFSEKDPTTPIFEWLPNKLYPSTEKNDPLVRVEGLGIKSLLGHARLEPYDWDGSDDFACVDCDWKFGGTQILQNGDFETVPLPNGGFEDGNTNYWSLTAAIGGFDDAQIIVAVKDAADADSGDWYGLVNPGGAMSGAVRNINGLVVGSTYTITGKLQDPSASGDRFRAGVSNAATATHTNAYEEDGYWWAEIGNAAQGAGASDGTWQTFTITFEAAEVATELVIVYDDPGAGPNFWLDTWDMSGDGVGLFPWEPRTRGDASILDFTWQDSIVHSGDGALRYQVIDALWTSTTGASAYGSAGARQRVAVTAGKTYTGSVWIRQDSGSNAEYIFIFRNTTINEGSAVLRAKRVDVPTATWTQVQMSAVAETNEIWFEVNFLGSDGNTDIGDITSPVTYIDDALLFEGLPETSVGDMLTQIYDHATNPDLRTSLICWDDGSGTDTPYLTLDFDDSVDSAGAAWDSSALKRKLTMRQSYSQIMAGFARDYGYEYRIVPNDVEAGTYLWQVYNPGTMQTDYTAAASPAIQGGASDIRRLLSRFLASGSDSVVEGLGRVTGRARNTDLMGAIGRIEAARLDREAPDLDAAASAADESILQILTNSDTHSFTLAGTLQDEPMSDYVLGDLLVVDDPPEVVAVSERFIDVVCSYTPNTTEFDVQFGSVAILNPDAAVASAVAGLLAKFEYPDTEGSGFSVQAGEGGGAPTITIAASNASEWSKNKADLICTGTNDHEVIMFAMLELFTNSGGRVLLSEGTFYIDPDTVIVGYSAGYPVPMILQGLGESTVLNVQSTATTYGVLVSDNCKILDLKIEGTVV